MDVAYLWEKLGSIIQQGLQDNRVDEIMLNPDGALWFYPSDSGGYQGHLTADDAEQFVHALAQYRRAFVNAEQPYLDAVLPFNNERINVTMPPICERVSFNIRKPAQRIHTLAEYVTSGVLTSIEAEFLTQALVDRRNILVSGPPGAGKTTFANALLQQLSELVPDGHRVLILEQVPELHCAVRNCKTMLTADQLSLTQLLWLAMRNRPDRIVVGEVRDGAALDLLKAWNTGCPGGIATLHSNHPAAAVQRLLDLACEVIPRPPYYLLAETIDIIIQLDGAPTGKRRVSTIATLQSIDPHQHQFILTPLNKEKHNHDHTMH